MTNKQILNHISIKLEHYDWPIFPLLSIIMITNDYKKYRPLINSHYPLSTILVINQYQPSATIIHHRCSRNVHPYQAWSTREVIFADYRWIFSSRSHRYGWWFLWFIVMNNHRGSTIIHQPLLTIVNHHWPSWNKLQTWLAKRPNNPCSSTCAPQKGEDQPRRCFTQLGPQLRWKEQLLISWTELLGELAAPRQQKKKEMANIIEQVFRLGREPVWISKIAQSCQK